MNKPIGTKIREIRESKGFSIKHLSEETNLSSSFISQVERNQVTPSIASLREIARVLRVPVFYLLLDDHTKGEVVRKGSRRKIIMPDSQIVFELLSPDLNRKMEIILVTLGKGECTFEHLFAHEGEEAAYCMQGVAEVTLGLEKHILYAGDSIYFKCDIPHRFLNVGEEEIKILCCVTPPSF